MAILREKKELLLRLIHLLTAFPPPDDETTEGLIRAIESNCDDPHIVDYVFWPDRKMSPEECVERALKYELDPENSEPYVFYDEHGRRPWYDEDGNPSWDYEKLAALLPPVKNKRHGGRKASLQRAKLRNFEPKDDDKPN